MAIKCPACGAKNKKPFYKKGWFILLLIIIVIGVIGTAIGNKSEKFDWDEVVLRDRLPKPKSKTGMIISNSSDDLSLFVEKTSPSDYMACLWIISAKV